MDEQLLKTLQDELDDKLENKGVLVREARLTELDSKIKVAIGMRRTGKTYFLYQAMRDLLTAGVSRSQILYINFEDDRLQPIDSVKLANLVDVFYRMAPENHDQTVYLFFDEIQNVDNWPTLIRRLHDSKRVQLYLTGSSAKLLSKEISTSLRGRSLATEMWPFSFREYLNAQDIDFPEKLPLPQSANDKFQKILSDYLEIGGFPEVVTLQPVDRYRVLQDYVNVVTFRDIVERHNVSNIQVLQFMIAFLLKNIACPFAVNKFFNMLKSQGFNVGRQTVYEYLAYIEDCYLVFTIPLFSDSLKKVQSNPKKSYAVDTGLAEAYSLNRTRNVGHAFENLIYLDLRRREGEIYYYLTEKDRLEVDFVTKGLTGEMNMYQVCWDLSNPETLDREMRALKQAEQELGIKGQLITAENYLTFLSEYPTC